MKLKFISRFNHEHPDNDESGLERDADIRSDFFDKAKTPRESQE